MSAKAKMQHIFYELKAHAPFTLLGAALGIAFMLIFRNATQKGLWGLFAFFHPTHVTLSAMVTASMFKLRSKRTHIITILLIGYFGSVGVATLSDIIIPHFGAEVFGLNIPTEAEIHHHAETTGSADKMHDAQTPHSERMHFGFIEEWYLVNPAAFLGIFIAYFWPHTKFPHAGHILISTWASAAYLMMDMGTAMGLSSAASVFVTLFLSVWLPCCLSDIVFPLLFIKSNVELTGSCPVCGKGGHIHL
jgi:hypothetical protein